MSQPKRYKLRPIFLDYSSVKPLGRDVIDSFGKESAYEHHEGEYVLHSDYAALAAENERLRKAGDLMAKHFEYLSEWNQNADGSPLIHPSLKAWLAAKEGRDAK